MAIKKEAKATTHAATARRCLCRRRSLRRWLGGIAIVALRRGKRLLSPRAADCAFVRSQCCAAVKEEELKKLLSFELK